MERNALPKDYEYFNIGGKTTGAPTSISTEREPTTNISTRMANFSRAPTGASSQRTDSYEYCHKKGQTPITPTNILPSRTLQKIFIERHARWPISANSTRVIGCFDLPFMETMVQINSGPHVRLREETLIDISHYNILKETIITTLLN